MRHQSLLLSRRFVTMILALISIAPFAQSQVSGKPVEVYCTQCGRWYPYGHGHADPTPSAPSGGDVSQWAWNAYKTSFDASYEASRRAAAAAEAERARLAEEARLAALEALRRRNEMYAKLRAQLDWFGMDEATFDGHGSLRLLDMDELLAPAGTDFFGERGASPAPDSVDESLNDPMVVDLRDVQLGYLLAAPLRTAAESDVNGSAFQAALLDEAFDIAVGDVEPVFPINPPAGTVVVDSAAFLAFQKANIAYKKATDSKLWAQEQVLIAQRQLEATKQLLQEEWARLTAPDHGTERQSRRALVELLEMTRREGRAYERATALLADATQRVSETREDGIEVLRAGASKSPVVLPTQLASIDVPTESRWMEVQAGLIKARQGATEEIAAIASTLDTIPVPAPSVPRRLKELVVLGANTDGEVARELAASGTSPFEQVSYAELNGATANGDGDPRALVVSFGEPAQGTLEGEAREVHRFLGDHPTRGAVSLGEPQAQEALRRIGDYTEVERAIAHSNGASVIEALLETRHLKIGELHIAGGDGALARGDYYQELVDAGKVGKVVIWVNARDPVPWGTSADPLLQDGAHESVVRLARDTVRKFMHQEPGVEYRFFDRQGAASGVFGPHYLEVYFDEMREAAATEPRVNFLDR